MKIYIIRHGETDSNKGGRLQGWVDMPLNENGIRLAVLSGRGMRGIHFDAAYSSPLIRAVKTAETVLRESGNDTRLILDDRLKEMCMGDWEGKSTKPENGEIPPEVIKGFFSDPASLGHFPNGESIADVMERTQSFLRELAAKSYENVLVSTHGCALRCMLNFLYSDPADFWHGHVPYNCCVNIVETDGESITLTGDDIIYYDESFCKDLYGKTGR